MTVKELAESLRGIVDRLPDETDMEFAIRELCDFIGSDEVTALMEDLKKKVQNREDRG